MKNGQQQETATIHLGSLVVPMTAQGRAAAGRLAAHLGPEAHAEARAAWSRACDARIASAAAMLAEVAAFLSAGGEAEREAAEGLTNAVAWLGDVRAEVLGAGGVQ